MLKEKLHFPSVIFFPKIIEKTIKKYSTIIIKNGDWVSTKKRSGKFVLLTKPRPTVSNSITFENKKLLKP